MERLTTNKPVDEMSMLELAYNSCYAENGKAMYRDFETVKDVRDFVREANVYLLDSVLPADDDEFDERMIDDLQYNPTIYVRGLIALFYRNLWAMADLRETLKAYEDKQEQGLLIELPCKVGNTVYLINHFMVDRKKKPIKCIVDELTIDGSGCYAILSGNEAFYAMQRFRAVSIKEFGKNVFLTQSEAEEALERMGGK